MRGATRWATSGTCCCLLTSEIGSQFWQIPQIRGQNLIIRRWNFGLWHTIDIVSASVIRYDMIRDAILTCARKTTWVGLIYRTETTTKNCKTEKLKSKSRYVRSNSKSLGNHVVGSEEEKERLQWEGFAGKGFKSGMKERVGDEKLIIITNKYNC